MNNSHNQTSLIWAQNSKCEKAHIWADEGFPSGMPSLVWRADQSPEITWGAFIILQQSIGSCSVTQSCLTLATSRTVAHQAPLSMGSPRQEHWSGLPFPSPGDLANPGTEPTSLAIAGRLFTSEPLGKPAILSKIVWILYNVMMTDFAESPICFKLIQGNIKLKDIVLYLWSWWSVWRPR